MPVVVPMMRVSECEQANHVDQEAQSAHNEQFLDSPQLPTLRHAFSRLPDEFDTDQHKENAVTEARKSVEFAPSVRHLWTGRPFRSHSSTETDDKS